MSGLPSIVRDSAALRNRSNIPIVLPYDLLLGYMAL